MTDQENHLKQVLTQQKTLVDEINALNNQITTKREMAVKLQGIAEYLDQLGVKVPEEKEEEAAAPEAATEVVEAAILDPSIAADPDISSLTIVPFTILDESTELADR